MNLIHFFQIPDEIAERITTEWYDEGYLKLDAECLQEEIGKRYNVNP